MRPNDLRAKRTITFLWIFTAISLFSAFSDLSQYFLLKRMMTGNYTMQEATANDLRQFLAALVVLVFQVLLMIFFIQWFRRAYYNLHQVANNLSFGEGWAAGSWFVPFLNLGRPYVIMKEMMYEAESRLIGANLVNEDASRKRSVGIWWTLWLISSILININSRIQLKSDDIDVLTATTLADVILSGFFIPLTIVTVSMIKKYNELEMKLPELSNSNREIRIDNTEILDSI